MAYINSQLRAAFDQFAAQPGVGDVQKAQLLAALTQDQDLLQRLNEDAAGHRLKEFVLSPVGSTAPNLAGTYDKASGKVTLPVSSFKTTGLTPSADLVSTLRLQDMVIRFAYDTWQDTSSPSHPVTKTVTQEMITNLQSTLNGSPVLARQIKDAVRPRADRSVALQHFKILTTPGAGGAYHDNSRIMSLTPKSLMPGSTSSSFDWRNLTFTLGHEIQHALDVFDTDDAKEAFKKQLEIIANSNNPNHDYTTQIGKWIQVRRDEEGKATIAGWNAWMSAERQKNPTASISAVRNTMLNSGFHRTSYFIDPAATGANGTKVANPRLIFNIDGMLPMSGNDGKGNIEQLARRYFDKSPDAAKLGYRRDSDYRNLYGADAVSKAIFAERRYAKPVNGVAPKMLIDMGQLGLSEKLMERNGIQITRNPGTPQPYYDTTHPAAPTLHHFDHTYRSHEYTANVTDLLPETATKAATPAQKSTPPAGGEASVSGPFRNEYVNRYLAILKNGDNKEKDELAVSFRRSPRGMELAERGVRFHAERLREEQQNVSHGHTRGHSRSISR